jgi:hypothetical protein
MARPIPLELPARDPREELRKRLEQAPAKHAEALLDSYELLQQLHDHGVFELLRGALGASDKLIETAVDAANSGQSILTYSSVLRRRQAKRWDATRNQSSSRQACSRFSVNSVTKNCAEVSRSSTAS